MAFSEETIEQAWERSSGQCECEKRTHKHFYTPCGKSLAWGARGKSARGGWEARRITSSGGDGLHNCEILCRDCYQSASGSQMPRLLPGPNVVALTAHETDYVELDIDEPAAARPGRGTAPAAPPVHTAEMVQAEARGERGTTLSATRKARDPFHFCSIALLRKMTGLRAVNLTELVGILKTVPDGVIYYHTHQFLQEHHYLTPEPPNDFAVWVADSLGDEVLGERLASVNPFSFPDLGSVREKLTNVIEEHIGQYPNHRVAMEGKEFYFVESKRFVFPTQYVAHDLREFVEALRKVGIGSLYFHIFESRLRSPKGLNDFSIWLMDELGEDELGRVIARFDPYTHTLEGLRSSLIRLIEKRHI